jgi:hypothetical protein
VGGRLSSCEEVPSGSGVLEVRLLLRSGSISVCVCACVFVYSVSSVIHTQFPLKKNMAMGEDCGNWVIIRS